MLTPKYNEIQPGWILRTKDHRGRYSYWFVTELNAKAPKYRVHANMNARHGKGYKLCPANLHNAELIGAFDETGVRAEADFNDPIPGEIWDSAEGMAEILEFRPSAPRYPWSIKVARGKLRVNRGYLRKRLGPKEPEFEIRLTRAEIDALLHPRKTSLTAAREAARRKLEAA